MNHVKTNEKLQSNLYYEWLNNLFAYKQQLESLSFQIKRIEKGLAPGSANAELKSNLREIKLQLYSEQCELDRLSDLVLAKRARAEKSDVAGALNEVLENNHLRDRVRKAERFAFYLKCEVNKLLSGAT